MYIVELLVGSGARILLTVGCQVGGDYRCNILYLLARRCVHMVGCSVGPLSLKPQCRNSGGSAFRVYCEPVWYTWVSGGEKCVVSGGSARCDHLSNWGCNNGTYVWLVGVLRR
jgi:hypothetical protein